MMTGVKNNKNTAPLVSIIIPSYNSGPYIAQAIDSLLDQSYKNIEIIVVNDGSTDNTENELKNYYKHIKYIYQPNSGVSAARNRGFHESRGEYICFMDADDWYYPENIKIKTEFLNKHPHIGVVHSAVEVTNEDLVPTGKILRGRAGGNMINKLLQIRPAALPCPANVMLRRNVVINAGFFDTCLGTSADFDMWLRCAAVARVAKIDKILVRYRLHDDSMFTRLDLRLRDMDYIFKKYKYSRLSVYDWLKLRQTFNFSIAGQSMLRFNLQWFSYFFINFLYYSTIRLTILIFRRLFK
jgi:glycosyltransferase involved in cell wall biosynthesis